MEHLGETQTVAAEPVSEGYLDGLAVPQPTEILSRLYATVTLEAALD